MSKQQVRREFVKQEAGTVLPRASLPSFYVLYSARRLLPASRE
jgi:hypothetical protein